MTDDREELVSVGTVGHIDHDETIKVYIECHTPTKYELTPLKVDKPYYRMNERW